MTNIDQTTMVVLGMHRTGTSLVAKALHDHPGCYMGSSYLGPDPIRNKYGFYEDHRISSLNHKILKLAGGSRHKPPSIEQVLSVDAKLDVGAEVRTIMAQLREESPSTRSVGFKDPKTALTIHLLVKYIPNPQFVVCYRSTQQVAVSLRKFQEWVDVEKEGVDLSALACIYNERIADFMHRWLTGTL